VRPIVAQSKAAQESRSIPLMFDRQHKIRVDTGSRLLRKIKRELSGFPLVGSIWNIAARATPSSRASDFTPGSGAFGWTTRRSSPAKLRRGRRQRIPSYGWSIRHWRSCRNRLPASGLVPSGYGVARNPPSTLLWIALERIPTSRVMSLGWQLGSFCVGRSTSHFGD
jgi:hypothetical protein